MPGQRIKLIVRARNIGSARAKAVKVKIKLPDELTYSSGSRSIDGAPGVDRERDPGMFEIGSVEPGRSVEVALAAVVRTPVADGHEIALGAEVDWSKGDRAFDRTLTVKSRPAFPAAFNTIERETSKRLEPGDRAAFTVRLENMGTDVAGDVRLHLDADEGLEGLKVTERDAELTIGDDGAVHLNDLDPNVRRVLRLEARVAPTMDDQTQLRLRATLRTAQLEPIDLGAAVNVIASRPRFSAGTSKLALESNDVLRPNRTTACRLTLHNEGTDRGRDVRVRLQLPEELRLESVEGGSRDGQTVTFGEVPAQATREATLHLRLVGAIGLNDTLDVGARVSGMNVVPFSLDQMQLATHAEASFADGATLTSIPADAVDAGEEITYTLSLRNVGDGAAKRLNVRLDTPTNSVYAPGSTTVNDVGLLDFAGTSPLLVPNGLTLGDVGAGVEVVVRLRAIVNTPLPADAEIDTTAYVTWDEIPEMTVAATPLRVRSAPALPIVDPMLPFSVLDAAAGVSRPGYRALPPAEEYMELPPGDAGAPERHARGRGAVWSGRTRGRRRTGTARAGAGVRGGARDADVVVAGAQRREAGVDAALSGGGALRRRRDAPHGDPRAVPRHRRDAGRNGAAARAWREAERAGRPAVHQAAARQYDARARRSRDVGVSGVVRVAAVDAAQRARSRHRDAERVDAVVVRRAAAAERGRRRSASLEGRHRGAVACGVDADRDIARTRRRAGGELRRLS